MHEGDTSSNSVEKEKKKKKKKKAYQRELIHSNDTSNSVNVIDCHEEKLTGEQVRLHSALAKIERLGNEKKEQNKLLQICDDREHEFKEEIINLRTQLEEARIIEEMMSSQLNEEER